jgi:deoxyribodipyrimidine photo-lyase
MNTRPRVCVHWFRRDLRTHDNHGLFRALEDHGDVLPIFIFDTGILDGLEDKYDRRVDFIHRSLIALKSELEQHGSSLLVAHGKPLDVWKRLLTEYDITAVVTNHDHEPYANSRDRDIADLLNGHGVEPRSFKDISVFERDEVMKDDGTPYTVFTPYSRKWRAQFLQEMVRPFDSAGKLNALFKTAPLPMPSLGDIGFMSTDLQVPPVEVSRTLIERYHFTRNMPGLEGTSRMSVHLRFGTVSPRALMKRGMELNETFANELIWREFFMQILWHFPHVVARAFKPAYDGIAWRNDEREFDAWCEGRTGYPLVDAGMRELNTSGHMHNRVRMVVSSFLTKHLLIDWRWGEAYFARKLLDFELSSNNGGWQWASGSGCDAAPYFRIFNPVLQQEKFDPALTYVKRWVPEHCGKNYAAPIVVHEVARKRAIEAYEQGLEGTRTRNQRRTELFN